MTTDAPETWQPDAPPARFPGVRTIIIVTVAVYLLGFLGGDRVRWELETAFALSAEGLLGSGRVWQLVTYQLLHGNLLHILLNLFMLFSFGRELEGLIGTRRLVTLYVGSGILGGLGWLALSGLAGGECIGASGSVFGVAAAFAAIEPARRLSFIIFPIPVPITLPAWKWVTLGAIVTVLLLVLAESRLAASMGWHSHVAHAAHLLGGLAGYLYGHSVRTRVRLGLSLDAPPAPPPRVVETDPEEINRILEKIKAQGLGSLSRRERDVLERASKGER